MDVYIVFFIFHFGWKTKITVLGSIHWPQTHQFRSVTLVRLILVAFVGCECAFTVVWPRGTAIKPRESALSTHAASCRDYTNVRRHRALCRGTDL